MNSTCPEYFLECGPATVRQVCSLTDHPDELFHLITEPDEPGYQGCIRLMLNEDNQWDARPLSFGKFMLSAARWVYAVVQRYQKYPNHDAVLSAIRDVAHTCGDGKRADGRRQICMNPKHFVLVHKNSRQPVVSGVLSAWSNRDVTPRLVSGAI